MSTSGSGDRGDLRCDECRELIVRSTPTERSVREARDILARWSSESLLDQISSLPDLPPIPGGGSLGATQDERQEDTPKKETSGDPAAADGPDASSDTPLISADVPAPVAEVKSTEAVTSVANQDVANIAESDLGRSVKKEEQGHAHPANHETTAKERPNKSPQDDNPELKKATEASDKGHPPAGEDETRPDKGCTPESPSGTSGPATAEQSAGTFEVQNEDASISIPAAERTRKKQDRTQQQRKLQQRTLSSDQSREGSTPVNRNIRVDAPGEAANATETEVPTSAEKSGIRGNSSASGKRYRVDGGEAARETFSTGDKRERTQTPDRQRYIDEPHDTAQRGPHFYAAPPKRSNLTALTGQFLAYLGVLGLTVGTAIVIYGHFGGHAEYTPTGWLVTTVAQMMLFLGVINLVSGGIEQTNDDVSARINHLGEQLMRIEQVTEEALRGPKISPRRYAGSGVSSDESSAETMAVAADD